MVDLNCGSSTLIVFNCCFVDCYTLTLLPLLGVDQVVCGVWLTFVCGVYQLLSFCGLVYGLILLAVCVAQISVVFRLFVMGVQFVSFVLFWVFRYVVMILFRLFVLLVCCFGYDCCFVWLVYCVGWLVTLLFGFAYVLICTYCGVCFVD